MKILVVLLLCAKTLSLPANQGDETPQDLLRRVLAANPLENDISNGLDETNEAKENENDVINNPAQVLQMLQKVLQEEENQPIPATAEQDLLISKQDYEPETELPLETSDKDSVVAETSAVANNESDIYNVSADVGTFTFDPKIEVTEEKPKSEVTEQVLPSLTDETKHTTPEAISLLIGEESDVNKSPITEDQTEATEQVQETRDVPIDSTVSNENDFVIQDKQELLPSFNPIIFPEVQPEQPALSYEEPSEKKDNFSQKDGDKKTDIKSSQLTPIITTPLVSTANETTELYVHISDEENPILSPLDTLPLDLTLESIPEDESDSYVETPLQKQPLPPPLDGIPMEENSDLRITGEDYPINPVPEEQSIDETLLKNNPHSLVEGPIEDSSPITGMPIDSTPFAGDSMFALESAEDTNSNSYVDGSINDAPLVWSLEITTPEEAAESILTEETPLVSAIDTLPLDSFYEEALPEETPEIPLLKASDEAQVPQDMAIAPQEKITEIKADTIPLDPFYAETLPEETPKVSLLGVSEQDQIPQEMGIDPPENIPEIMGDTLPLDLSYEDTLPEENSEVPLLGASEQDQFPQEMGINPPENIPEIMGDTLPLDLSYEDTLPEENSEVPLLGASEQDQIPQEMGIDPPENIPEIMVDTLPLDLSYEDTLPEENSEVPLLRASEQDQIPQEMAIDPSDDIQKIIAEPMPMEPEDSEAAKEPPLSPVMEDTFAESPAMDPVFDEANAEADTNPPEDDQDITQDDEVNTNYSFPSLNETPESGLFDLNPSRPLDDYPINPSFNANQENRPYKPIQGMDENFVRGQFYPNSNVGPEGNFQLPQYGPGLDEISDSFEYNPYGQVPFLSSQSEPHYNPHWGFPDIYKVPKYNKRPSFNLNDRHIGNKYYDRDTYDSFPVSWEPNKEFNGYNQQHNVPGFRQPQIRDNPGKVNSFISGGGRPLFPAESDSYQMQYERDAMDTLPSHKFVPMVGMPPPINRHHPISEIMASHEEVGIVPDNTKDESLQLPIFNLKNQMEAPGKRYNDKFPSEDPNYNTFYVVDSNIPQNSQVVPKKEHKFTDAQTKDTKITSLVKGTELTMNTNQGFSDLYYPGGERVPAEISPSTYTGSFEPQYFGDSYTPNVYPPHAQRENSGPYLNSKYTPYDSSPYYSEMGYHKPYFNYRDEFYY